MYRNSLLVFVLFCLSALALAQRSVEVISRPSLERLAATIQAELQSHGERVLGHGAYRWSTRLGKIENCRAELTVRVDNNVGEASVRTETVEFSVGALEPYAMDLQKGWLELPCANREKCIFSTSTCSGKSKDGIVIDCGTASQKRVDSFRLEYDGDVASASRLQRAFRQAINLCRAPKPVTF